MPSEIGDSNDPTASRTRFRLVIRTDPLYVKGLEEIFSDRFFLSRCVPNLFGFRVGFEPKTDRIECRPDPGGSYRHSVSQTQPNMWIIMRLWRIRLIFGMHPSSRGIPFGKSIASHFILWSYDSSTALAPRTHRAACSANYCRVSMSDWIDPTRRHNSLEYNDLQSLARCGLCGMKTPQAEPNENRGIFGWGSIPEYVVQENESGRFDRTKHDGLRIRAA